MYTSYNSFLLESATKNLFLLLEGNIFASSDFLLKLKQIEQMNNDESELAESLIDMIENEFDFSDSMIKQNFFDVTDEEDKVSFIQNNKVERYWRGSDIKPFNMAGRSEMKVGRALKYLFSLLHKKVTDKQIESFVNLYKSMSVNDSRTFKLVNGDDIHKYYSAKKVFNDKGSLGNSCMEGMSKPVAKLYTKNKDVVSLLVYVDADDKVLGRALVWKLDKSTCEAQYFMDRVYTNNDSDVNRFLNYARENGWMYRQNMSLGYENCVLLEYNGKDCSGEITVKVSGDLRKYPYLDTLKFLSKDKSTLSNLPSKKCWMLEDHDDGERERCCDCEGKLYTSWGGEKEICGYCCDGHIELSTKGIITDVFRMYGDMEEISDNE